MRRCKYTLFFIGLACAWPFPPPAQAQAVDECKRASGTIPIIGFLNPAGSESIPRGLAAFRQGLNDAGYVEGYNLIIDYRWANGNYDLLPGRARQLVECNVALIAATGGTKSAQAAKDATKTIPIVFGTGFDPVKTRLADSYTQPGGNATGIAMHTNARVATRRELLAKMLPGPQKKIAVLQNPTADVQSQQADLPRDLRDDDILKASSADDLEVKFAEAKRNGYQGIVVAADPFFGSRRAQIVALAARNGVPAIYPWREYVETGGLMSYGISFADAYRQIGLYAGRILNGAQPAGLPVIYPPDFNFSPSERELQATSHFELAINLATAKALGLGVPLELVQRANFIIGQ
jgi:putative ABC transport system substrate-binding protein